MKTIAIKGTLRSGLGKRSTKDVRNNGMVPCVIYGGESNLHFSVDPKELRDLIYTNEFRTAKVELEGKVIDAIVKEVQFHPTTDTILHVDMMHLVPDKKIKADIPIRLVGVAAGVKVGGVLMQKVRKITVKTTPDKLSNVIELNVEELTLGKSIRVRDVKVQEGVEILNAGSIPLASIEIPRALRSKTVAELSK